MSWKRNIKATSEELAYRDKHFHDIRVIKSRQITCTSCGNELNFNSEQIFSHPLMGILQCETCWDHLKKINVTFDESKNKKSCYLCGDSKRSFNCVNEDCVSVFCKACIKRNAPLCLLNAENKDWKCFICKPRPIWDLRAVCAIVTDSCSKRSNGKRMAKKYSSSSKQHQLVKAKSNKKVQKTLSNVEDDSSSSEERPTSVKSMDNTNNKTYLTRQEITRQKKLTDIMSIDSKLNRANISESDEDKQRRSKRHQDYMKRGESIQDSGDSSSESTSKSAISRKRLSKKSKVHHDSQEACSDISSSEIIESKHTRSKIRTNKMLKSKKSNYIASSDSESDSNSTSGTSNISKSLPKRTMQQNKKKNVNVYDMKMIKDRTKKHSDASNKSENENVQYKKENKGKYLTNRITAENNKEQRCLRYNKSLKRHLPEIDKDHSDSSSSREFQKSKSLRGRYSTVRPLANLDIDYTESPIMENFIDKKRRKNIDESNQDFDRVKEILNECKNICSNFKAYIGSIEQLYQKNNEEKIILKSIQKINKFKTVLDKKQKYLTILYQSWPEHSKDTRILAKQSRKDVSDNERSSKQINIKVHEEYTENEDEDDSHNSMNEGENKNVSECDSDEIFSADETRTPQKVKITKDKADTSKMRNNFDYNNAETDNEDGVMDTLDNINNTDSRNNLDASPVLGTLNEEKNNKIQLSKKRLSEIVNSSNNEAQLITKDIDSKNKQLEQDICDKDIEMGNSPIKANKATLQNNRQDNSAVCNDTRNESLDISFNNSEDVESEATTQETDVTRNGNKVKSSRIINTQETSLQAEANYKIHGNDETSKDKTSLSHYNEKEDDLSDRSTQRESISTTNIKTNHNINGSKAVDISKKTNINDMESLTESEALAKKALLHSDSDISDASSDTSTIKQLEESNMDDINSKKDKESDNTDNSVNSHNSTIILSTLTGKDTTENSNTKAETTVKDESRSKKNLCMKDSSSNEDEIIKAEKAAKKALLESNSDESIISSFSDFEKDIDKQTKSASDNANAKRASLTSSNSESSNSESMSLKRKTYISNSSSKHNLESDIESSKISQMKKGRFKLKNNYYYMNDEMLRMSCKVHIKRLDKKTLKRYSRALQRSRLHLEHKALKRLVDLEKLEKRSKKSKCDSDMSTDDDTTLKTSKRSRKQKGKAIKEKEECLMDHLKRIENDDMLSIVQTDSNSDESIHHATKRNAMPLSNEALMLEANEIAKQNLLTSDSDDRKEVVSDSDDSTNNDKNEKDENKKLKHQNKTEEKTSKQEERKKGKNEKSSWRQDKILRMKFSDTDSDIEKRNWDKKQKRLAEIMKKDNSDSDDDEEETNIKHRRNKYKRRILESDSDIKLTDVDSDNSFETSIAKQNSSNSSDIETEKNKRRKKRRRDSKSSNAGSSVEETKPKPKRKRIKKMASDSDSSDAVKDSQGTPGKSGRKNIRKVLKDKQVADDTKQAAKEEEERLKRIAERQALYNEMYEMRLAGEEKVDKIVLDFDTETKEELVSVHEELVKRLKPHQAQGIKFMWDACFESLERIKTTSGSGCIIAHCMGLGKTLQVVTLTYTLLTHEATGIRTVLVVCPLSTVLNWINEYRMWLKDLDDDINIYELTKCKRIFERKYQLKAWQRTGGILVIGYDMFRNLTGPNKNVRKKNIKEAMLECLVEPGADLVICDEGHLLKNEDTALSKCIRKVKTLRRIVLTGTPLQNNLIEYHCMVQFVKPNLLGTKKEFLNRFVNPIMNGQFDDSTAYDVKLMKKRAHVLHKMLEGSVQRFDYSVLTPFLPPKQEYVIFIRLTDAQIKMYQYYLDNLARRHSGGGLFADFQALQRIWTHPMILRLNAEKIEKANEKKDSSSDTEGSLKDFINDSESETSESESSSDSNDKSNDDIKNNVDSSKRKTRNNPGEEEPEVLLEEKAESSAQEAEWWSQFVQPEHYKDIRSSAKLLLLFGILKECEQIGDKVLVFSQSLYSLTIIEQFLEEIDTKNQEGSSSDTLDNHSGSWSLGLDYFRLDGQTSAENRTLWCKIFNKPTNTRARLFLISTRAGGLGINLTAANRVIIFDASWNPSHDVQSIFRIYRFGQKKPCYVYRFLAAGTMEEKIYNRQVTKLSLSCRVVDEQQIERHYSNRNLNELYMFETYNDEQRPTLGLPKDRLLAEIFLKYKNSVENYHEHDSLLENKAEEELDEEERKQAWLEYEEEKKGRPVMNPAISAYQNNMFLQQCNMMNLNQTGNMSLQYEYENLQQLIRKDYPNASLEQQKLMTNRAMMEMYNYWEQQAVLQPAKNSVTPNLRQMLTIPHTATNSNLQQVNQPLTLQSQSGNYINKSTPNITQRSLVVNPFTYLKTTVNSTNNETTNDDIIEVIPTTSNTGIPSAHMAAQSTATSKNQEE